MWTSWLLQPSQIVSHPPTRPSHPAGCVDLIACSGDTYGLGSSYQLSTQGFSEVYGHPRLTRCAVIVRGHLLHFLLSDGLRSVGREVRHDVIISLQCMGRRTLAVFPRLQQRYSLSSMDEVTDVPPCLSIRSIRCEAYGSATFLSGYQDLPVSLIITSQPEALYGLR